MISSSDALLARITAAAAWLQSRGIAIPDDLAAEIETVKAARVLKYSDDQPDGGFVLPLEFARKLIAEYSQKSLRRDRREPSQDGLHLAIKTIAHYTRVLWGMTRDLYNGEMDYRDFVDEFAGLVEQQLRRAWNEGMRSNDLDPQADMTDEWEAVLQDEIAAEFDHIEQFGDDVRAAAEEGKPVDGFRTRVDLWANRYEDVVNLAVVTTRPDDRFEWIYGDTVHCSTCEALNGIVATGKQWEESGYRPQNPPNDALECGGWKCQCRMEYTEKPLTEGGIPDV